MLHQIRCIACASGMASLALFQFAVGASLASAASSPTPSPGSQRCITTRRTPHADQTCIVIIGENRSFDHVFATYKPKQRRNVWNLLSEGIINADGTPGPNFSRPQQLAATDQGTDSRYFSVEPAQDRSQQPFCRHRWWAAPRIPTSNGDSLTPRARQSENGSARRITINILVSGGTG